MANTNKIALLGTTALIAFGRMADCVMARAVPKRSGPGNLIVDGNRKIAVRDLSHFAIGDRIKLDGHPYLQALRLNVIGME